MRSMKTLICGLGLSLLLGSQPAQAEDVLIRNRPTMGVGQRLEYTDRVLAEAMRRTRHKYGPYRIEWIGGTLARERMLLEMLSGEQFNTTVIASQPSWEEQLLPIWIPVDMGLSNYRISLTHRNAQARIAAVRKLADLKALPVGVGAAWSSRKIMEANGFNLVTGESFDPLLKMLMAGRFDYFPRGMNEVFVEFDARSADNPDLAIENSMLIEFPLPTYIFVSPKTPRLHQRLREGMEMMVADGSLQRMLIEYHEEMIRRTNFCQRRVFRIENPLLTPGTPLQRKEVWFNPWDPKSGLCAKPAAARRPGK
ncbi:ABC transporter substrate-binding protein [Uliginosibacterium sp. TH139]|uniref:substrate-binding periplasmic protein n=1 Tax=Uliginosibacterium sp. TH139 TaxID=2067453 RepID=UPI00117D778E|nr:amino acid ABC transporter substrate-binding protein [Uliginosibacterium sp. TH139]